PGRTWVFDRNVWHLPGHDQRPRRPAHRGTVADIYLGEARDHAMLRLERPADRFQPHAAPGPQHELRAFGGEAARARLSDTRARPRDENQLSLDAIHPTPTRCCVTSLCNVSV